MLFQCNSVDELILKIKVQGALAPEEYKKSVELYYIARYFVSVFEARNYELPIQIWNEHRNALDHFFRFITKQVTNDDDTSTHHRRCMEGHICRAALDAMKLTCHKSDEFIKKEIEQHNQAALSLVDNGQFLKDIKSKIRSAENSFINAKTHDYNLGSEAKYNRDVVKDYLNTAFEYENLRDEISDRSEDIINATNQFYAIHQKAENNAHKKSFFKNVYAGFVGNMVFQVFILALIIICSALGYQSIVQAFQ